MKGHTYQLLDKDGENVGLIYSDYNYESSFLEKLWNEFYNSFDCDADEFVEWFNEKPRPPIERIFVTEINPVL